MNQKINTEMDSAKVLYNVKWVLSIYSFTCAVYIQNFVLQILEQGFQL